MRRGSIGLLLALGLMAGSAFAGDVVIPPPADVREEAPAPVAAAHHQHRGDAHCAYGVSEHFTLVKPDCGDRCGRSKGCQKSSGCAKSAGCAKSSGCQKASGCNDGCNKGSGSGCGNYCGDSGDRTCGQFHRCGECHSKGDHHHQYPFWHGWFGGGCHHHGGCDKGGNCGKGSGHGWYQCDHRHLTPSEQTTRY